MFSKLLKLFICSVLILVFSISFDQNNKIYAEQTATINTDVLNVRTGPGLTYGVMANVRKGEKYSIIARNGDWVQIKLTNGKEGWVASWLIKEGGNNQSNISKVISTSDGLRVRTGPGTNYQVIGSLSKGETATFVENNENWTKIKYNNQFGWVFSQYITYQSINTGTQDGKESTSSSASKGTVNASILNVRSKPSLEGIIIGKLKQEATVTITSQNKEWVEISFLNGKGWVHQDYITFTGSKNEQTDESKHVETPKTETQYAIVTASSLNVRDSGSLSGKIIAGLKKGNKVQIEKELNDWCYVILPNGSKGWVASWYLEYSTDNSKPSNDEGKNEVKNQVTLLYNGTNIRSGPSTSHSVISRANAGDSFGFLKAEGDWYKINLPNNKTGYIAGWLVKISGDVPQVEKSSVNDYVKNKTIVIDPGHGGADSGAIGFNGTLEKKLTLRTAQLVADKLDAAGAKVVMTRNNDYYVSLASRVSTSHYHNADVFISVHYDSFADHSVRGITSYYYKSQDEEVAAKLQKEIVKTTNFKDRNSRKGNYQVLRENKKPSTLLELGFISNSAEEYAINTNSYQENVSTGIFNGIAQYFKGK